eukprot:2524628-Pyramimonas_sp.AAC.1
MQGRTHPSERGVAILYNFSGFVPLPHLLKGFARAPRRYHQRPRQSSRLPHTWDLPGKSLNMPREPEPSAPK